MAWTSQIRTRIQGKEAEVPWWVNNKYLLNKYCLKHSIPTPQILQAWKHPHELDLTITPDSFVLKPSVMHSAKGVMVLTRLDDNDVFHEALSNRQLDIETIRKEQNQVYEACKFKGSYRLLLEERIVDETAANRIPLDYKIFCFYDTVALTQQLDRNVKPTEMAWFDADFNPLPPEGNIISDWDSVRLGEHQTPAHPAEMARIATRITQLLNTPFMSVDMFDSPNGPVVGELTPTPGGPYYGDWYKFSDQLDESLGQLWEEKSRQIGQ